MNRHLLKYVPMTLLAMIGGGAVSTASAQEPLAEWTFNYEFDVAEGIGTPNTVAVTSNGNVNLEGVKLKPNSQALAGSEFYVKTVRHEKTTVNNMQSSNGAYWEINAIAADGAVLHMTSPLPNPATGATQYQWGESSFDYDPAGTYSYQNPYDYFEFELNTVGYKSLKMEVKAAGHNCPADGQKYVMMTSPDGQTWTQNATVANLASGYKNWTTTTFTLPADMEGKEKCYVRLLPAETWKANATQFQDNQFNLDNVKLSGELSAAKAEITAVSIDGQTVTAGEETDWACNLPKTFSGSTVTFGVTCANATLSVTACAAGDTETTVSVTDNGDGTYTIPAPEPNTATIVTMQLSANDGALVPQQTYTLKIFRIGEISMTALTIDGIDTALPDGINDAPYSGTIGGNVYTTLPVVVARFVDGSTVTGEAELSGNTATYTIPATMGDDSRTYTLSVEGMHIYTKTENDETVQLKYTTDGKAADGNSWTNGLYTFNSVRLDGWNGTQFKINSSESTLDVPGNVVVKQVILKDFYANSNLTGTGELVSLTSEGATAYIPAKHDYQQGSANQYDLIVNLENHKTGEPIAISLQGGGQPVAWFELTVEQVATTTEPVLRNESVTPTETKNHCVVALTFDREMTDTEATIGNQTITAEGGTSTLYFSVWDLNYNTTNTLTVAAGAAKDTYGNSNSQPISVTIVVGSKAVAEKAAYDYVVSTAAEFTAAVTAVNASNTSADAARKVIFIKNGDYDFGENEQRLTAYNVSLIGESRDGVILHGNRTGISYPVLNLRDRTGFYLQDLTVRNDFDYGKGTFAGVAVAIYGGNKTVMKNVRMLSNQDTQVTGERAYFEDCEIHGTVDFICGGGDNFYWHTDLVLENRGGCVIAAPSTNPGLKWGYVFQECTVKAMDGATAVTDKSYSLGRPWQNEPRCNFLNTTMEVLCSDAGWAGMSSLPTHFYEYNSMKADGSKVDLSKRANSPTSTNTYTPVLTEAEAAKYTMQNVLGGTDSWLPTEECAESAAPVARLDGTTLSWDALDDARCYVIFLDGKYVANVTETSYTITEGEGAWTVRSANLNGGLGGTSNAVNNGTDGIGTIDAADADAAGEAVYNLKGQRVSQTERGQVYIMNGKKVVK